MKEKYILEKATVFLVTFVLIIGFVGLGVQVYGQDSATSDISVTASETRVEVWNFYIEMDADGADEGTYMIQDGVTTGDYGEYTVDPANSVQVIEIEIKMFDEDNVGEAIDEATVTIEENADGSIGDSIVQYTETWTDITESSTEATLTATWTGHDDTEDNYPFLRFGDWDVNSEISSGESSIDTDNHANVFDVALYRTISVDDTTIEGTAEPGQILGDTVAWTDVDEVTFSINDDYHLTDDVSDLQHTTQDYTISSTEWTTDYGTTGEGEPSNNAVFSPGRGDGEDPPSAYTLNIPEGQEPGTYEGTITHNLNQGTSET